MSFDPNNILKSEDLYSLPEKFNSAAKIQNYLEEQGSFLASYMVDVSLESDDDLLLSSSNGPNLSPYMGQKMLASELVWKLSRTSLGSGCSIASSEICINNSATPVNPNFILTKIQKESGLIFGQNSKLNPQTPSAKWLLDRATGYFCTDSNKEKSCYPENPNWRFYEGFFRQVYYSVRLLRLVERRCDMGGKYAYPSKDYFTGNTLKFTNFLDPSSGSQDITFRNGITCSLYVYTPYIQPQKLFFCIWWQIQIGAKECNNIPVPNPVNPENRPAPDPALVQNAPQPNKNNLFQLEKKTPKPVVTKPVVKSSAPVSSAPSDVKLIRPDVNFFNEDFDDIQTINTVMFKRVVLKSQKVKVTR